MAITSQDFVIRLLSKVDGAKAATLSLEQLNGAVLRLTEGQYKLTAAGNGYDVVASKTAKKGEVEAAVFRALAAEIERVTQGQVKLSVAGQGAISVYDRQSQTFLNAEQATERISKATKEHTQATVWAKNALLDEAEAMAKVQSQSSGFSSSQVKVAGSVSQFHAQLANLTNGQVRYIAESNRFVTADGQVATSAQVAAIAIQRLSAEQNELSAATKAAVGNLKGGQQALLGAHMGVRAMAGATGSASFAVLSLGQGFQDAGQFGMGMAQGIRAVTNNVQQAFQAFIMLRTIAGSTTAAMKAFWTSMMGPAGLLLAFGAVTAAIEYFSNKSQKAKEEAEALKATLEDVANILRGTFSPDIDISIERITNRYRDWSGEAADLKGKLDELYDIRRQLRWTQMFDQGTKAEAEARQQRLIGISEQIAALEPLLAKAQEYVDLYGEAAQKEDEVAKKRRLLAKDTDAMTEAQDRLNDAVRDLREKIRETTNDLTLQLNPAVRALQAELERVEGAEIADMGLPEFTSAWIQAKYAVFQAGLAIDDLNAKDFAKILAESENLQAAIEAFLGSLQDVPEKLKPVKEELTDLERATQNYKNVLAGGLGLAETTRLIADLNEKARQTAEIFAIIEERGRTWRDQRADLEQFLSELEGAGVVVDNFRQALADPITLQVRFQIGEYGDTGPPTLEDVLGPGIIDATGAALAPIDVTPPDINLRPPANVNTDEIKDALDPSTFLDPAWAEEYDRQVAEAEASNQRLMQGVVKTGQIMSQAFGGVGTALMQLAKTGDEVDKKMFETGKAFAIADAVINTAVGITRAYKDLPIWAAIPASISIAAAGAAQIATIRAARPGGGASPTAKSITIGSAPQLVFGTSGNVGQFVDTGQSAASFSSIQTPGPSNLSVNVQGVLVGNGRDLVAVVREENEAQTRLGIQQPLGA